MKRRVAIQGVFGAFHEEAARAYYSPEDIEVVPNITFHELINSIKSKTVDSGIMAVENSVAGSILSNYLLISESGLSITGEYYLPITQNLIALPGQKLSDIREVRSHPVALFQCRKFFSSHPWMHLVDSADTALSVKEIAEKKLHGVAGVGSCAAADLYKMEILASHIEAHERCTTRFLELNRTPIDVVNANFKASVTFVVMHTSGSLAHVLLKIGEAGINLTSIQSLPIQDKNWEYRFYVDMECPAMGTFNRAIKDLTSFTQEIQVIGTYKKGNLNERNGSR